MEGDMYEIRKASNTYRVYDKLNKKYVGYTKNKIVAEEMVSHGLIRGAFEGQIPQHFFSGYPKYGTNFDKKILSD